jgi:hypothetical protein
MLHADVGVPMVFFHEKQQLDEMAASPISSRVDLLPFRVTVQHPDHRPPHAHLKDLETGKEELGQFLIPPSMPRQASDIKDYKQGIPDRWRELIFQWCKKRYTKRPAKTNWDALYDAWLENEDDH